MEIEIRTLRALKDNFIYALIRGRDAVVVDPGETGPVTELLDRERLALRGILCTHHHADHVGGIPELLRHPRATTATVWTSTHDRQRIPGAHAGLPAGRHEVLGEAMDVLDLPGHTLGQVGFHFPRLGALFVGDTLFSLGCGRLFEGTAAQMHATLQKIKALPAETRIYFGHEYTLRNLAFARSIGAAPAAELDAYEGVCTARLAAGRPTTPTTLADEVRLNPFLRAQTIEAFQALRERRDHW